jgi:hypothetical protein
MVISVSKEINTFFKEPQRLEPLKCVELAEIQNFQCGKNIQNLNV